VLGTQATKTVNLTEGNPTRALVDDRLSIWYTLPTGCGQNDKDYDTRVLTFGSLFCYFRFCDYTILIFLMFYWALVPLL
jgi:hypothetical protein